MTRTSFCQVRIKKFDFDRDTEKNRHKGQMVGGELATWVVKEFNNIQGIWERQEYI